MLSISISAQAGRLSKIQACLRSSHATGQFDSTSKVLEKVLEQWNSDIPIEVPAGYRVRFVHGFDENNDFNTLTQREQIGTRKIVFTTDAAVLEQYQTHKNDPRKILQMIGYPEETIDALLQGQAKLKLLVYRSGEKAKPATWKNVFKFVEQEYGSEGAGAFEKEMAQLAADQSVTREIMKIYQSNPDPGVALEKMQEASAEAQRLREFLRSIGFNENFTGSGETFHASLGTPVPEYIHRNLKVNEIKDKAFIELRSKRSQRAPSWQQSYDNAKVGLSSVDNADQRANVYRRLREMDESELENIHRQLKECEQ